MELVLLPTDDGEEIHQDDALSEREFENEIRDVGRGVLQAGNGRCSCNRTTENIAGKDNGNSKSIVWGFDALVVTKTTTMSEKTLTYEGSEQSQ